MALMLMFAACTQEPPPIVEASRDCGDVFGGQVCTWTRMQGDVVVAAGADIPMASIENAPDELPMGWPPAPLATIPFPDSIHAQTGLTHLTVYWEAHGHPPGPYLTPHFDFHFYSIPEADRLAIDCTDTTKPALLATGYEMPDLELPPEMVEAMGVSSLVGLCVPQMGMHSLLASELASTEVFRGSMVLGYYHAAPIFIEPMITKAMLMERQSFDLQVAAVPGVAGARARTFRAEYDAAADAYHFTFNGFMSGGE
jgi:hypothetical protein